MVNVRDAGGATQPQLAAEPKPQGNWDSAGYLHSLVSAMVGEDWVDDGSGKM